MENSIEYFGKVNGLLILFFVVYVIFLKKDTFFQYNRWFLMIGLLASLVLPLIILRKIIWVERPKIIDSFDAMPIEQTQQTSNQITENIVVFDWNLIFMIGYFTVMMILFVKLFFEYYSYKRILKNKISIIKNGIKTFEMSENINPFSFFKTIVLNPSLYSEIELKAIIAHENVHVRQFHSVDVLVSKLFTIVFWYNPIIWFYRKFMIQNLEYIADNKAVDNYNFKQYQYTLLKHTTNMSCVALTNPFYQSLIKKRIVMLNKKPSTRANHLKLAIIAPMLAIFVWQFQTKIVAQEKISAVQSTSQSPKIEIEISKNTTDVFMATQTVLLKKNHNIDLTFSKLRRNKNAEITAIKVVMDDHKGNETEHEIQSDKGIGNFQIVYDVENGKGEIGYYTKRFKNSKEVPLTSEDDDVSQTAYEVPSATAILMKEPPTPPTPPMPPSPIAPSTIAIEEMLANMPKPPIPPAKFNNKKSMIQFAKSMRSYEDKMAEFTKKIDETHKASDADMEIYNQKMKAYDEVMREYDLKMKAYDTNMEEYSSTVREANVPSDSTYVSNREDKTEDKSYKINNKKRVIAARKEIIEERKVMIAKRKQKIDERNKIESERRRIINEKRKVVRRSRAEENNQK